MIAPIPPENKACILKTKFDLDAMLSRIRKCIGGGRAAGSKAAIEEVWEDVAPPMTARETTIEIAGEMESTPCHRAR